MKIKVLSILILLIFMAILPFAATKCGTAQNSKVTSASADIALKGDNERDNEEILCGLVAALYSEDYHSETIKALTILLNTDYITDPQSFDLSSDEVCIYEDAADYSLKAIYPQIEEIVNSSQEISLFYNDKNVYIPYSTRSNGYTVKSQDFPYLSPVASPWDCYSSEYDENLECQGVSIEGINYLCGKGMSAKEALLWYLPDFEIK